MYVVTSFIPYLLALKKFSGDEGAFKCEPATFTYLGSSDIVALFFSVKEQLNIYHIVCI